MKPINLRQPVAAAAMLAAMLACSHTFAQAPAPGVDPAGSVGPAQPTGVEVRDPAAVAEAVEAALRQDRRTADLGVAVSIDERQVVGLHGLVPTPEGRTAAGQVAARVKGVREVSNRLVVPGE